jgi:hypothetical protein
MYSYAGFLDMKARRRSLVKSGVRVADRLQLNLLSGIEPPWLRTRESFIALFEESELNLSVWRVPQGVITKSRPIDQEV